MGIPFARSKTVLEVKAKNDLFRESYFRSGHATDPEIMVAMHVYLHPNKEEAVKLSRPHYLRVSSFLGTHRRPGSIVPDFDHIRNEKLAVFTSPQEAAEIFSAYQKIGVTHIICMVNFGGVPMPDVRRTLELMSKEVMPRL
jgi:alkanesulfonate monooxygenase SsuD/methylene tetrahydromethanopterin reductase-like flavin-dependent oxidoreductase (luciferase family)